MNRFCQQCGRSQQRSVVLALLAHRLKRNDKCSPTQRHLFCLSALSCLLTLNHLDMRQPSSGANRRLLFRVSALLVVGMVATYLQNGYQRDGQIWMLYMEFLVYFVGLVVFLSGQTGRLKSGPETSKISSQ